MNLFVAKNLWINHYLCLSLVCRPGKILFCRVEKVDRILKMNIGWNKKKYDAFTEPRSVQQKWSLDLESRRCSLASSCSCSGTPVCTCLIFAYLQYLHISSICIYNICTFLIFAYLQFLHISKLRQALVGKLLFVCLHTSNCRQVISRRTFW